MSDVATEETTETEVEVQEYSEGKKKGKLDRRGQVKSLIEEACHTKAEIADKIGVSQASVSSQMTYLRWMGNFIKYDADKILSFCTEEEYEAWQAELQANRKTKSTAARTPEEQAKAVAQAIERQEKQLENWEKKLAQITADLQAEPEDDELLELEAEANANITLLQLKIKRNAVKAEELPDIPEEDEVDEVEETDEDQAEGEESLL
jgi:hypothetical protein